MNLFFSDNLRKIRIEKGLSQQELADLMYVTRSTVVRWETGSRLPDAAKISRLSEVLGTDINTLIFAAAQSNKRPNVIIVDDRKLILSGELPIVEQVMPGADVKGFTQPNEAIEFAKENNRAVIPNGIDDFWLSHSYAEKNPPAALEPPLQLLFAGRVLPDKNLRGVVSAVQLLRSKGYDADFTVIGPHPDRSLYEELKQYDFVTLKEPMEKEKLIDAYRSADIFVMPSFHETFGLVYAEAMSQGLPVIYSKGEGFDGQFPDGEVGFAVDPGDPRKIADAIKLTAGMYGTISAACPEKVKKFNWNQIADNYHSFYEEICYEISTDNRAST